MDHPKNILKPFEYCANHSIEISDEVVNEVKKIKFHKFSIENKKALYSSFYDFLKKGKNVYVALKTLNNSELINFFIPEFEKIKDLAVADPSHIYTVDVHSLFVVNEFDKLLSGFYKEEFPLETKVANGLKRREVFYLASLLHDIGKGFGSNHAKKGAEMCKKICSRLTADKESYDNFNNKSKIKLASSSDFGEEFLDLIVSVKIVENIDEAINSALGLAHNIKQEILDPKPLSPTLPATVDNREEEVDIDYQYSRENFYSLVERGQDAVTGILELAKESEHPRTCLLYTSDAADE